MMASRARSSLPTPGPSTQQRAKQLPDYQPPSCPMNPDAQQALAALFQRHDFTKLRTDFEAAITTITDSVTEINERLTDRRERVEKQAEKSRKRKKTSQDSEEADQDVAERDERAQADLQTLTGKVESMTKRMDESIRKMIDGQQGLASTRDYLTATMQDARQNASTQATIQASRNQTQARAGGEDNEDDNMDEGTEYPDITPTNPEGATQTISAPSKFFKQLTDERKLRYQDTSLAQRYGEHDAYKNFRQLLHGAQFPDESVPLPNVSDWFEEGVLARPGMTQRVQDDDDEDIQIQRATTSTKCPITLREFVEPLTSKKCSHTFEADAIREMISTSQTRIDGQPGPRGAVVGGRRAVRCPAQSCQEMLGETDLYVDAPIVRRIRRLQQRDSEVNADDHPDHDATIIDDDEDADGLDVDDYERDEVVPSTAQVKNEALRSSMRH